MASQEFGLMAKLKLNAQPFEESMNKIKGKLNRLNKAGNNAFSAFSNLSSKIATPLAALTGLGGFSISGVINQFLALGDAIDKASIRAGVGTEALQKLRYAGKLSGMTAEEMDKSLAKLSTQMGQAATGKNDDLVKLFKSLGVSWRDSSGRAKNAAVVMREIADSVKANVNPAKRLSILNRIFGDEMGAKLVPVLKDGADGLDSMAQQAEDLGLVLSQGDINSSVQLGDKLTTFKDVLTSLGAKITSTASPALMSLVDNLQKVVIQNKDVIAQNLSQAFISLSDAIKNIDWKGVIDGVSETVRTVSDCLDKIGGVKTLLIGFAAIKIADVGLGFVAVGKAVFGLFSGLVALLGWPGVLVAAIAGGIALIVANWDTFKSYFVALWEGIQKFWNNIWDGMSKYFSQFWDGLLDMLPDWAKKWIGGDSKPKLTVNNKQTMTYPDYPDIPYQVPEQKPQGLFNGQFATPSDIYNVPSSMPAQQPAEGQMTIKVTTDRGVDAQIEELTGKNMGLKAQTAGDYYYGTD